MKVSYQWLEEYIDLTGISAEELAEKMSRTGIEVDDVRMPGKGLSKLVVGKTLQVEDHPDSDHLHICQVDVGEEEPIQIICGAPNIAAGQKVIVALHGARITGNTKIKRGKIRGQVSNGMICSLDELGYAENVVPKKYSDGIFVLPEETPVGEDALSVLRLNDAILDLDITPNRADALSMRGAAHEVAAIYGKKVAFPNLEKIKKTDAIADYLQVSVADTEDTPAYHMVIIKDVEIKESPLWLQTKLMNAGMRPVNNVVDITNYILLEYGQPLHAFDYDQIGSKEIMVRRAAEGETIRTLDGTNRTLDPSDIVITNGKVPIALAGVMGGYDSEITAETKNVALEFALFDALRIRKTGTKFNLRSESSARFEKGINVAAIEEAGNQAAALIQELAGGEVVEGTATGSSVSPQDEKISITLDKINSSLGTAISQEEVLAIFHQLGFGCQAEDNQFWVSIPPRRWDIKIEADIVEEVARIYGYDRLPATLPVTSSIPGELTKKQRLVRASRNYMEAAGLTQNISYVLTSQDKATAYAREGTEAIRLAWPMSEEHSTLRVNLLASLLENAAYNVARKNTDIQFYEIGKVFLPQEKELLPIESERIGGILTGQVHHKDWQRQAKAVDFYAAKGVLEGYFDSLGLTQNIRYAATSALHWMHPGRTADIYLGEEVIGYLGQIHPLTAAKYDLPATFVFELNLDSILEVPSIPISQELIPKFPGTTRDLAILVEDTVTHQQIMDIMEKHAGSYLVNIRLFDLYQGEGIEEGMKSMAYSLSYLNPEATLTDEEITPSVEKVVEALETQLHAKIR